MAPEEDTQEIESARGRWRQAQTFPDLCELTAQFVEGKMPYLPGCGASQVNSETQPLIEYLAALNRSGLMTRNSQPGSIDGAFKQRAFVDGFSQKDTALRVAKISLHTDLHIAVFNPGAINAGSMTPVTVDDFRPYTWAGFSAFGDLKFFVEDCPQTKKILEDVWYVVVIDLVWGRENHLWEALATELCYSVKPHPELDLDRDIYTF